MGVSTVRATTHMSPEDELQNLFLHTNPQQATFFFVWLDGRHSRPYGLPDTVVLRCALRTLLFQLVWRERGELRAGSNLR